MSTLQEIADGRLGSIAALARKSGIAERLLRDISNGDVQPDDAHVRRIKQALGNDVKPSLFPHRRPEPVTMEVSEARVVAVREELVLRPHEVKADDMMRLVETRRGAERFMGWVKAAKDAEWARGDLVRISLKDDSVVECHPAQTVTVARKPAQPEPS